MERELLALPEEEREAARTKFAVFVVHNKLKEKAKSLPEDLPCAKVSWVCMFAVLSIDSRYYPGSEVEDFWCVTLPLPCESVLTLTCRRLDYPWEMKCVSSVLRRSV